MRFYPINNMVKHSKFHATILFIFRVILRKLNVFGSNPMKPIATFYGKLSDYANTLSAQGFLQINKSTMVNMGLYQTHCQLPCTSIERVLMNVTRKDYTVIKNRYIEWRGTL